MGQLGALFWHRLGRWFDGKDIAGIAESCYRTAGQEGGKTGAKALLDLAKKALAREATDEAKIICQQAVQYDPASAPAWCALGVTCRFLGDFDEARRAFDKALEVDPGNLHALNNIGELHLLKRESATALSYFDGILERAPSFYEAMGNRVVALIRCDRLAAAEQAAREALEKYPDSAGLHVNLGTALMALGRREAGLNEFIRALELQPNHQEAKLNVAFLREDLSVLRESLDVIQRKIALEGETLSQLALLMIALRENGRVSEAEEACRRLLARHPESGFGWNMLARFVGDRGEPALAAEYFKKALELLPTEDGIFSNVLFKSTELSGLSREELFRLHREWAERYEQPLLPKAFAHARGTDPEKCLRIGYVSGDFRSHPVGHLLRGVVGNHDGDKFEIHCFSTTSVEDAVTDQIRAGCEGWHNVHQLPAEKLAELVRSLGIDILVDLAGHTALHRLTAFALKPAPIQASWIGYFHSTGLDSIDYFITDPHTSPPDLGQLFSEAPAWLPHSRFCFWPPEFAPDVLPRSLIRRESIVFGSFNRLSKLSDPVIDVWSRIVTKVPNAKLLIKARELGDAAVIEQIANKFEARGLSREQLIFRPASSHFQMLAEYADVDIALDCFPFNGGMTTLEALWMGVPVIALEGNGVVSRQTTSALVNIGLDELVFSDIECYVAGAVALAKDIPRLSRLRGMLRLMMSRSPLCDTEQFAADLELLYRRMWRAWCLGEKLGSEAVSAAQRGRKTVLHVGCGMAEIHRLPKCFQRGWREVRLDIDGNTHPDILSSVLDMSAVASGSMDAVYAADLLQYLYAHELPQALSEMKRVLKPGGFVMIKVPDLQGLARMIVDDQLMETAYDSPSGPIAPFDLLYGHRGFIASGMPHVPLKSGFTLTSLTVLLQEAEFETVIIKTSDTGFALWAMACAEPLAEHELARLQGEWPE